MPDSKIPTGYTLTKTSDSVQQFVNVGKSNSNEKRRFTASHQTGVATDKDGSNSTLRYSFYHDVLRAGYPVGRTMMIEISVKLPSFTEQAQVDTDFSDLEAEAKAFIANLDVKSLISTPRFLD